METLSESSGGRQAARRNFLVTGARSFLQGAAAMAKFHREVYQSCRKALENRLPELETALGIKLDAGGIVAHPAKWDLQDLDLTSPAGIVGARLWIENWGNIYSYCWWRYGEDGEEPVLSAVASIEPSKVDARAQWERALKSVDARVRRERGEWELWIERILTPDAFSDLETCLDELLGDFAALLAKARALLKPHR
jgi:hypothetical protein